MNIKFKLFVSILFSKKSILVLYIMVIIFLLTFLNFRLIESYNTMQQADMPDIVVKGKMDADGELKYKYYNDISDLADQLKSKLNGDIKIYSIVARSMMTERDPLTNNFIEYTIYGVSNEYLQNVLNKNIQNGSALENGGQQLLMGSYAKNYYDLKIGDKVNQPITLKKDWLQEDIGLYQLSGELSNQMSYFKGGIFLSREDFEEKYGKLNDNMIFIYVNDKNKYNEALDLLQNIKMNDDSIGTINMNYYEKHSIIKNTILNCVSIGILSIIIILLLVSYLMKGSSKKIGILKALGMPNKILVSVFNGGMMIVLFLSMFLAFFTTEVLAMIYNSYLSNFYGFRVKEFTFNFYCILADLILIFICFGALLMRVYRLTMKTSPKAAMQKIS